MPLPVTGSGSSAPANLMRCINIHIHMYEEDDRETCVTIYFTHADTIRIMHTEGEFSYFI